MPVTVLCIWILLIRVLDQRRRRSRLNPKRGVLVGDMLRQERRNSLIHQLALRRKRNPWVASIMLGITVILRRWLAGLSMLGTRHVDSLFWRHFDAHDMFVVELASPPFGTLGRYFYGLAQRHGVGVN